MPPLIVPVDDRTARPLWRNVSFQLMWSSVAASGFGDRLIMLAAWSLLGIHLAGAQASSIQASVSFFFFLPYVVLGLPAGWLADTLPRKWLLLFCDEARAAVLLLAFLLVPAGPAVAIPQAHHWKVLGIIMAVGTLAAIFNPTKAATVPQIVPVRQLQSANAIVLGIAVIASLIGFLIGGPIIEEHSVRMALIAGVLAYGISGSFFAFLRIRPHEAAVKSSQHRGELQRMWDAVRYTWQHRPVLELTLLNVLFWTAAHVLVAAIAALCKHRYNLPTEELVSRTSTMMAVMGAGMLLSSLLVAWINTRRESSWLAMIALLLVGVAIVGLAANRSYNTGLALAFAVGFFGNAAMIIVATLTQSIAPDYMLGRVFGVRDLLSTASGLIVNLAIWRLPDADAWMTPALYVLALLLTLVSLRGFWTQMVGRPLEQKPPNVLWRLCRLFVLVWHRVRWVGKSNVPMTGAVILAANHTTGLDPFLMQSGVPRIIRWIMLQSYRFRILEPFLWKHVQPIAINQGAGDLASLRQIIQVLKDGQVVGIFPEGRLQRDHRDLQPFAPGIGMIAVRSGAMILPVWIHGTPRAKRMLTHFMAKSQSTVVYGKPYRPDPAMSYQQIADDLRQRMLDLAAQKLGKE